MIAVTQLGKFSGAVREGTETAARKLPDRRDTRLIIQESIVAFLTVATIHGSRGERNYISPAVPGVRTVSAG